ncbi:MAG: hypothetical protein F6K42_11170, partial [Leptolyngbya sp. SIO1D8]|nr:hypothetical protein [Leptolyngbya sp. SIO1D8]
MAYGSGTATENNTATGINNFDALIAEKRWKSKNVTFSFTSNFTNDYEEEAGYPDSNIHAASFSTFNPTQQAAFLEWVKMYENVSGLNLIQKVGPSDRDATIRVAESNNASPAYAGFPGSSVQAGDIWFHPTDFVDPDIGDYAYFTMGHELGHAIGLEHGHEESGVANTALYAGWDSMEFSIMTYRSYVGHGLGG